MAPVGVGERCTFTEDAIQQNGTLLTGLSLCYLYVTSWTLLQRAIHYEFGATEMTYLYISVNYFLK